MAFSLASHVAEITVQASCLAVAQWSTNSETRGDVIFKRSIVLAAPVAPSDDSVLATRDGAEWDRLQEAYVVAVHGLGSSPGVKNRSGVMGRVLLVHL